MSCLPRWFRKYGFVGSVRVRILQVFPSRWVRCIIIRFKYIRRFIMLLPILFNLCFLNMRGFVIYFSFCMHKFIKIQFFLFLLYFREAAYSVGIIYWLSLLFFLSIFYFFSLIYVWCFFFFPIKIILLCISILWLLIPIFFIHLSFTLPLIASKIEI